MKLTFFLSGVNPREVSVPFILQETRDMAQGKAVMEAILLKSFKRNKNRTASAVNTQIFKNSCS